MAGGVNPSHRGSEDQKNFDWVAACEKCLHFRATSPPTRATREKGGVSEASLSAQARPGWFVRDDLIFWLLFDQAKSSINYNKRKKNENGQENEYGRDDDLKRFRLFNKAKNNAGIQSSKVRMKI